MTLVAHLCNHNQGWKSNAVSLALAVYFPKQNSSTVNRVSNFIDDGSINFPSEHANRNDQKKMHALKMELLCVILLHLS